MANSTTILAFLTILLFLSSSSAAVGAATGGGHQLMWLPATAKASCRGTIGECMLGEEEFEMDSESNRRILATSRYISYEALKRNHVPCSRRGASYYNCRRGAQANPYSRGCSAITRCRR